MGKTATRTVAAVEKEMKTKKKKGRPSLADLQKRKEREQNNISTTTLTPNSKISNSSRRSIRRNPSNYNSGSSEFLNDDDDDDERKEKKVKLVVRLPESNNQQQHLEQQHSSQDNSGGSGSDSEPEDVNKKRKINVVDRRSNDVVTSQGEKGTKARDNIVDGSTLEESGGPTTPLPDKKLLVFILDRLQKKDTYGVFSEPVDPNELPDYHEIIEHPMEFGTVRKKLESGRYSKLEELEADVFLICSNAMEYNAADTVYYRQARSIQELAKRDFENLRHEGDDGEPQPKIVRRGRPPSKNVKKPVESSPADRVALEHSSGATLASGEERGSGSNGYNLRKAPALFRFRSGDGFASSLRPRNGENYSEWLVDWNSEFPASILKADMKYGKKHFSVDENRRDTYKLFHPSGSDNGQSYASNAPRDPRRFIPVGPNFQQHGYARSLATYAADLGPVAWKVASRKLKSTLPDGIPFGPGWVGKNEAPSQPLSVSAEKQRPINGLMIGGECDSSRPVPSFPGVNSAVMCQPTQEMIEAVRRLNSQNEAAEQCLSSPWITPGSSFPAQQKPVFHPNRNGFNAMLGYDASSQMSTSRFTTPSRPSSSAREEGSTSSYQMPGGILSAFDVNPGPSFHANPEELRLLQNWGAFHPEVGGPSKNPLQQILASQQGQPLGGLPPDLNVRVQTSSSPSSSLQIGSPQQPDLALQL